MLRPGETPAPAGRSCCASLLTPFCLLSPWECCRDGVWEAPKTLGWHRAPHPGDRGHRWALHPGGTLLRGGWESPEVTTRVGKLRHGTVRGLNTEGAWGGCLGWGSLTAHPPEVVISGKPVWGRLTHRFAPWGSVQWGVLAVAMVPGSPWVPPPPCAGGHRLIPGDTHGALNQPRDPGIPSPPQILPSMRCFWGQHRGCHRT